MLDHAQAKTRLDVYLAEYHRLKSEQVHRIGIRDNLVYASLVATAAVVAYAFDKKDGSPLALLALPLANFVLGWLHTSNDAKSWAMGRYLREILSTRVHDIAGSDYPELTATHPCLFGWESEVRIVKHRRWRKLTELVSSLLTFWIPGVLALSAYGGWYRQGYGPGMNVMIWTAIALESGLLIVLAIWLLQGADIRWVALKDAQSDAAVSEQEERSHPSVINLTIVNELPTPEPVPGASG